MNKIRNSLLGLAVLVIGCDDATDTSSRTELRVSPPPGLEAAACPAKRQIARVHPLLPGCPSVQGWLEAPLFNNAPDVLNDYCRYLWLGDPGDVNTTELEETPGILAFNADCEVVFEQNDALWDAVGSEIEQLFHHAIGRVSATDLALPGSESGRYPVTVAVVDSVPNAAPPEPRSEHGEIMAGIIHDIACPDPRNDCAVDVEHVLGLPRYETGQKDLVNGGYFASQADVATAIYAAVEGWKALPPTNGQKPKLVINLSLGWDSEPFGDMTLPVRPAVRAVHDALQYASCYDAILVAAAGNEGHLCTTEPLLPGGFEQLPAPGAARCANFGLPAPSTSGAYRPLVYSIGGVNHNFDPIAATRADGMPRLVAAASHGVALGNSSALTGTSVSSAVAAGAAALLWSYNPDLEPAQVMDYVYESGHSLSWTADYVLPGGSTAVHAIDVCAALEAACDDPGSSCPSTPFDAPLACLSTPAPVTLDDLFETIATLPDLPEPLTPTFVGPDVCPNECGGTADGYLETSLVGDACPERPDPLLPITLPQPTEFACPNCVLDPDEFTVYASLDPEWVNETLEYVTISVTSGTHTDHYRQGWIPLSVDEITRIRLDGTPPTADFTAKIELKFASELRVVSDDLLVGD